VAGTAFAGIALLGWPLLWVLPALGVVACTYAWFKLRALDRVR
jgi:chromate transporter